MTVKAIAFKSGGAVGATFRMPKSKMARPATVARLAPADSPVAEATWPTGK